MDVNKTFTHTIEEGHRCHEGMLDEYTYVYAINAYYQYSFDIPLRDNLF